MLLRQSPNAPPGRPSRCRRYQPASSFRLPLVEKRWILPSATIFFGGSIPAANKASRNCSIASGIDQLLVSEDTSRSRRSDAASMSERYLVVHVAARGHLGLVGLAGGGAPVLVFGRPLQHLVWIDPVNDVERRRVTRG